MRLATQSDIEQIEAIVNDHRIIEGITNDDSVRPLRAAPWLENGNFVLVDDGCCFIAISLGDYRYAVHTNILPEHPGHAKARLARAALRYAFVRMPVVEMVTAVPTNNMHVAAFAGWMGFRFRYERPHVWPKGGHWYGLEFYALGLEEWIEAGHCQKLGATFHHRLEELVGRSEHVPDPMHDCYVGAAVELIQAGQPERAVAVYNHWARCSGYEEVALVSHDPLVIDIRSRRLKVVDGQFFLGD